MTVRRQQFLGCSLSPLELPSTTCRTQHTGDAGVAAVKESPHARMGSGAEQARAFTGGVTTGRLRVTILHSDALSIN
jgi:hypothetical protein